MKHLQDLKTFFHADQQMKRNQPQAKGSSHLRHLTSYNESLLVGRRDDLKGSLRNLIARVSENRQDRVSNPRPEGDQTSGKRGRPALQVDPPLKIIGTTSEQSCL